MSNDKKGVIYTEYRRGDRSRSDSDVKSQEIISSPLGSASNLGQHICQSLPHSMLLVPSRSPSMSNPSCGHFLRPWRRRRNQ